MTILLFGRGGQVATELEPQLRILGDVTCLGIEDCDFARPSSIAEVIATLKPQVIVNAAAYTAVDKAEEERDLAFAVNATAVGTMATSARALGALLVHYSTDYVFDGQSKNPYLETDPCAPTSVYGQSKRQGEILVSDSDCAHMIFRTAWVYSTIGKNFLKTMVNLASQRETLCVVSDQIGTPTHAATIATATTIAIQCWLNAPQDRRSNFEGLFHLTATAPGSWWEFASLIVESLKTYKDIPCRTVEAITTDQFPTPAKRPAYSVLNVGRTQETFGIHLGDWRPLVAATVRHLLSARS